MLSHQHSVISLITRDVLVIPAGKILTHDEIPTWCSDMVMSMMLKILLPEQGKTKLRVHFQITVKVIIMIFKVWGRTRASKQKNLLPYELLQEIQQ